MDRGIDPTMAAELPKPVISPVFLALLTFRTSVQYVCNAPFPVIFGGNTFVGVGSYGSTSAVSEGTEIEAKGITLSLSGIDPVLLQESLEDIGALLPAKVWLGLLSGSQLIGAPYCVFAGVVDKPSIRFAPDTATISLALETRTHNLNRASNRRYTSADQNANGFPDDSFFDWVEKLNNQALRWG